MAIPSKVNSLLQTPTPSDKELLQFRLTYRTAVEGKSRHGFKLAVIVAHMRTRGCPGMTETYFYKLYDGTRPLTAEYIVALPDPVNAVFYSLLAEQRGHIVITPAAPGVEAVKSFVSGLLGLQMPPQLPAKAGPAAKASLSLPSTSSVPRVGEQS